MSPDESTARGYELGSRLLYGPGSWFDRCHAAAQDAAPLRAQLAPGHEVREALAVRSSWPGRSRLQPVGAEDGSALSAARATVDLVDVLSGAPSPHDLLHRAAQHWRASRTMPRLRLTGDDFDAGLADAGAAAAVRRLAVLADETPEDAAVWALLALQARALRDVYPSAEHDIEVPVLFDRLATGGNGLLRLRTMTAGPPGLYPDPRTMTFLVADEQFAESVDAAWATAPSRVTGRCVTWELTTDAQPCDYVIGGSLGAAFAVALAELARPAPAALRVRRLDRRCAVTAGLRRDKQLMPVTGTRNKLEEAARLGLRVVLAPAPAGESPAEDLLRETSVRYAVDLPAAIKATRTRLNRTFAALMVAVVIAAGGVAGGVLTAVRQNLQSRDRAVGTRLVAEAATLRSQDPAASLLLEALALRLRAPAARTALVADLIANRYDGALPSTTGSRLCNDDQAWSADGTLIATVDTATVTLWDVANRRRVREVHTVGRVSDCAFSPDGTTLAIAAGDDLRLVDPRSPAGALPAVREDVQVVRFARNGMLVTENGNGAVRLWSLTAARVPLPRGTIDAARGPDEGTNILSPLTISPDSRTVAVTDIAGTTLIDARHPDAPRRIAHIAGSPECAAFAPDSATLAIGRSDGLTSLVDVRHPEHPQPMSTTEPAVRMGTVVGSVAFTPDGRRLITDGAGRGEIWNVANTAAPAYVGQISAGPHQLTGLASAPDGTTVLAEDAGGGISFWHLDSLRSPPALATLPLIPSGVSAVAYPVGPPDRLTVATFDGSAQVWDVGDPHRPALVGRTGAGDPAVARGTAAGARGARFSPDGRRFAVGGTGSIATWQLDNGGIPHRTASIALAAGTDAQPQAMSDDGTVLLADSDDSHPVVYRVSPSAQKLGRLPVSVSTAAFAPDGRTVATRDSHGIVTWWDVSRPGEPTELARRQTGDTSGALAYTADGRMMAAVADSGGPGAIFDTSDRSAPAVLAHHPGPGGYEFGDAAFIGTLLVTGAYSIIDLWDLADPDGATLLTQFDGGDTVSGRLAVSPSGDLAVVRFGPELDLTRTGNSGVRLWDLTGITAILKDPVAAACRAVGTDLSPGLWHEYAPELKPSPVCR